MIPDVMQRGWRTIISALNVGEVPAARLLMHLPQFSECLGQHYKTKIFLNLNEMQKEKLHLAPNALYNEITCYYPSATGDGEVDSYVKINTGEGNVWDYGVQEGSNSIVRTTWEDLSAMGNPIGVDLDGYIMQHEVGYDADGQPMLEEVTSGFFDIADGQQYIYIDRFLPDFKWFGTNPSLNLYVILRDYAGGENAEDELVKGPYLITPSRQYAIVRARARQAAIKIVGRGVGSGWRLGATRYTSSPSGRR
jgi:hypothetical protein